MIVRFHVHTSNLKLNVLKIDDKKLDKFGGIYPLKILISSEKLDID